MTAGVDIIFQATLRAHQAGDLGRAEAGYNAVLRIQPAHGQALHYLGLVAYQRGDAPRAIALIERALAAQPDLGEAQFNLGNIFRETGQADRAETCYRTVLRAEPGNPAALLNLANLLRDKSHLDEAETMLRRLVAAVPRLADAHGSLGAVSLDLGKTDEAIEHLRRAAQLAPQDSRASFNLGVALETRGDLVGAEASYRHALALSPQNPEALNNLGNTLMARRQNAEALGIFDDLGRRYPDNADFQRNLAIALHRNGRLADALEIYQRLIALQPDDPALHASIGTVLSDQGRLDEAIAACRRALAADPNYTAARSNMLFALSFNEGADPHEVYQEHRVFDELHAAPLTAAAAFHPNNPDPGRRLRVGYVSPDFRRHPCGFFLLPVIEHHDRQLIESFCYFVGKGGDGFTRRFKHASDHWIQATALPDDALAERIRSDNIDILVECFGHMAENRLLAMARKPAPVQVSFPMYPNTSGLSAIDYRLMDAYVAPPGVDAFFSERLVRLPDTHLCYEPQDRDIAPAIFPRRDAEPRFAFGCFNNTAKIGPRTVALWSRILRAAPSAVLVLKWRGIDDRGAHPLVERFRHHGIGPDRLTLLGWAKHPYEPYRQVDLCLDPIGAAGGTTTCDALWMGVPVLTIFGETPLSRMGLSLLSNVGLTELIAPDEDRYVEIAVDLASDPQRLTAIRAGLRARFAASPLMNAARYTRHLEEAYRRMWTEWCATARA